MTTETAPVIRAPRGPEKTAKGWIQEAAKRMLMNNLDPEVAEHPENIGGVRRARQGGRATGRPSTRSWKRSTAWRTTRRYWCSRASRWRCCEPTSGHREY